MYSKRETYTQWVIFFVLITYQSHWIFEKESSIAKKNKSSFFQSSLIKKNIISALFMPIR